MLIASGVDMTKHRVLGEDKTKLTEVIYLEFRFNPRCLCKTARPPYAYGMYQAALLAERLGLSKISAIEFGWWKRLIGNGLDESATMGWLEDLISIR